jgi:leader peptidase (prepilin peptidase)/N-methyltransferase
MEWWTHLPLIVWCLFILALGLMIGSFINVLVARLPYEKSVIWPSSRCFSCYRKIRFTDNIPILGYLRLGGKCRYCHEPFSARYLWVEVGTGCAFLALFLTEVVFDRFHLPGVKYDHRAFDGAVPSGRALAVFAYHAVLLAALIAAAVVDAEHRIIPTPITYTALAVGVIGGALMPWPWPHPPTAVNAIPPVPWFLEETTGKIPAGVQPWPFWGPTFDFAPPGSWKLGLLTAVFGALVGSLVVRATKWLFETGLGREAMGLGDADLLMMAGAFLGWQIAILSLFIGAFCAILLKLLEAFLREEPAPVATSGAAGPPAAPAGPPVGGTPDARELPFGPGLALGVVVTWFAWPWLGPKLQFPYFDATSMGVFVAVMGVGLLASALFLRRPAETEPAPAR